LLHSFRHSAGLLPVEGKAAAQPSPPGFHKNRGFGRSSLSPQGKRDAKAQQSLLLKGLAHVDLGNRPE
jgi:hypothetical protein